MKIVLIVMHIIYFINSIKYLIRNKFTKIRTELCNLAEVENFQEELEEECGQALEQKVVLDMLDTQKIAKLSYSFSVLVALIIQITIILFSIKAVNGNKYHLLISLIMILLNGLNIINEYKIYTGEYNLSPENRKLIKNNIHLNNILYSMQLIYGTLSIYLMLKG